MSEKLDHSRGKVFSRREWLMAIALIAILEAWVLNASYAFQSEQAVINYVSFAATITSLLLAVIAIIYGFYQSDGQQKSAAAIASQIDGMRAIQTDLDVASKGISTQLVGMVSTAAELAKLSSTLEVTHKTLGVIEGGISGLMAEQRATQVALAGMDAKAKLPVKQTEIPQNDFLGKTAAALFQSTSYEADLLAVALVELGNKKNGEFPDWTGFIMTHYATPLSKLGSSKVDLIQLYIVGSQLLRASRALGFVKFSSATSPEPFKIAVAPEVVAIVRRYAEAALTSDATKDRAALIVASFNTA